VAERKIVPVCPPIDPEERKRRLSRVYTILLDLAAQQEAVDQDRATNESSPSTKGSAHAEAA
jgi:hypothetical protein